MKESQHTPTDTPKTALDEHFIDYYLQVTIFRIPGTFNFQKRAGETSPYIYLMGEKALANNVITTP